MPNLHETLSSTQEVEAGGPEVQGHVPTRLVQKQPELQETVSHCNSPLDPPASVSSAGITE